MKTLLSIGIILLFIGMSISSSPGFKVEQLPTTVYDGKTLYVGGSGPGNYSKIQDAIDNASDGDTVFVFIGTYYESLYINKSISVIGQEKNTTLVYGHYNYNYVVNISANGANINGFTIENIFSNECCIFLDNCKNIIIAKNIITPWSENLGIHFSKSCNSTLKDNLVIPGYVMDGFGIRLSKSSNDNTITGNIISDNICGLSISNSNNNTIMENKFSNNWESINLLYSGNDNMISSNNFSKNQHDIIVEYSCKNNTIINNTFSNVECCMCICIRGKSNKNIIMNNTINTVPGGDGIIIRNSKENTIIGNTIINLKWQRGIYLWSSSNNTISCNNLIHCNKGIVMGGNFNSIYHNNFINNKENANDSYNNTWDNSYPSGGNFWDDYNGTDEDGDGIGDTPYPIPGGDNEDRYPLMEPYGNWTFSPYARFTWIPSLPDPNETIIFNASESIDYDGNITLYEWDWDNDGEFDENHTNFTATYSWLEYGYYPVTLRVTDNDNLTDNKTKTVRVGNQPPYEPSNPNPPDGATNISDGGISWTGGDPDPDDIVTYDVYFGKSSPPPLVVVNLSITAYDLGVIDFNTTYYWQIVAWDNYGASTVGPIWSFTTITASLELSIVRPVEKSFYLQNMHLFSLPRNTIIVGYIDIIGNVTSNIGVEKVEFYIDGNLKSTIINSPYNWTWDDRVFFRHKIKVIAYDNAGNKATKELKVWKFL